MERIPELVLAPVSERDLPGFRRLLDEQLTEAVDPALAALGLTRDGLVELAVTQGEVRAVEAGGEVAGYVWLELRGRILHVHGLFLAPGLRGRGLGGRTLAALEREFRDAADALELAVHDANPGARRLYERSGFREVERRAAIGFTIMRKPVRTKGESAAALALRTARWGRD